MKRILITGANSYIGTSFANYLSTFPGEYQVDTVDMIDGGWKDSSFEGYDTVFHVAGIAHADTGAISDDRKNLYYSVNTSLAIETASKAKREFVGQFIYMSSALVYGDSAGFGKQKIITPDTPTSPSNCYGDSKVQAELGLRELEDESFKVVVLRPPMVYGKGCKGNYPILSHLAVKLPVFPLVDNCRSMIHIDNLCEFIRLLIENSECGTFWPQNAEYSNTSELVGMIARAHGKRVFLVRGFGWALKLLSRFTGKVNKAFGSLCYIQEMSRYKQDYQLVSLKESIDRTEL